MSAPLRDDEAWSSSLTLALLGSTDPDEQREWIERARSDVEARLELAARWRAGHADLVKRLDEHAPEVLAEEYERDPERPPMEEVLLLLLSDPLDHGWDLVGYFCDSLKDEPLREQAQALVASWSREAELAPELNVLIVGGIAREAETQLARLESRGVRGLDWIPISRGQGRSFNRKTLARVRQAAALVIVTGRISHGLMQSAREEAEAHDVPVHFVERASERQLDDVLHRIGAEFG